MPTMRDCRKCWSTLKCDDPLPEPLDDLKLKGIPPEPLREFLEDQGFKSLLNRLVGGAGARRIGQDCRHDVIVGGGTTH